MKKILYIISAADIGGGQIHLLHLLKKIRAKGAYKPYVFCMPGGELEHRIKRLGIEYKTFEMENLWQISDIWRLGKAIKELKPDLIHCHLNRAALYGSLFGKFLKIPVISTAHGLTKSVYYRFSDYVICVSDAVKNHMMKDLSGNSPELLTIHNGIPLQISFDERRVHELRKQFLLNEQGRLITVVGTFHKNKGQDVVLRAINKIPESHNVSLLLTGSGPEEKSLKELAGLLSLAGRIHFLPHQPELGNIYKASDLIIVPSHQEALSLVVLEALLHETPVVASRTGGIPEIITDKREGILVPPGDSSALAKDIVSAFDNYRTCRAMAKEGCKKVKMMFSLDLCFERTQKLYTKVLHM